MKAKIGYLTSHGNELKSNGYRILKGSTLRNIKLANVDDTSVADIIDPKAPSIGVFSFRSVLNVAMNDY